MAKGKKKNRRKKEPEAAAPAPSPDLRRGISPGEVPYESIVRILEAARFAPSAANLQPWVFLLVREAEMKKEVARLGEAPGREPYREIFWRDEMHDPTACMTTCGALIVVFGERKMPFWRESCWSAISRMELAAFDEGLVTIAYQPGDTRLVIDLFQVPEVYSPVAVIAVGLPDGTLPITERKPLETIAMEHRISDENLPIRAGGPPEDEEPDR